MDNLYIEATKVSPRISFDAGRAVMEISGKSYPENTFDFYGPVMAWLKSYFEQAPTTKTVFNLTITYFNSSSSKLLYDMFDLLEEAQDSGHEIEINWIHDKENESAEESGMDFKEDFESLRFNLVVG
ncbi:MAG: DUF1987 domain-containing protein [Nitrospirae bacterium]|uniref:DUF1987 domain-containing protein n=1 Tax=Candidatus Magnetobacterium casense TaxID=1455061 RepID=UPI00058F1D84|nr:DUF1987 domain-containing protein [Candidatus Magnetobacterium casensis]MBF0336669.1 DUF1987 domain-containing protein [Nitrospirota bacterium]